MWNIYSACYSFLPLDHQLRNLYLFNPHFFNFSRLWNLFFSLSPGIATSFRNHLLEGRGTRASIMQEPGSVRGNHPDLYDFSSYSTSSRILHPGILHSIVTNFILRQPYHLFFFIIYLPLTCSFYRHFENYYFYKFSKIAHFCFRKRYCLIQIDLLLFT